MTEREATDILEAISDRPDRLAELDSILIKVGVWPAQKIGAHLQQLFTEVDEARHDYCRCDRQHSPEHSEGCGV